MGTEIVAIIRGITKEQLIPAFEAAVKGGIKKLEVTMNTEGVLELIKMSRDYFKDQVSIGAGTVCHLEDMHRAIDGGAQFIVSPLVDLEMIKYCHDHGVPVYPGAMTPTEIYRAWDAGATMVKVFPVNAMGGPDYIKSVKGPLDQIKLLACNGVNLQNCQEYIQKGADAIALGSQLFRREWLETGEYDKIYQSAKQFSSLCSQ